MMVISIKILHIMLLVMLAISSLLLISFMALAYAPVKVIEIKSPMKITNVNNEVKAGEMLYGTLDYIKYQDYTATVTKHFINNLVFIVPDSSSSLPVGKHVIPYSIEVPECLPTGRYHVFVVLTYHVNFLRNEKVEFNTEEFNVIGKQNGQK